MKSNASNSTFEFIKSYNQSNFGLPVINTFTIVKLEAN